MADPVVSAAQSTAELITCSYSGDLESCRLLCESVDRFASPQIRHRLYVPKRDFPLFAGFVTDHRTIAAQEDLLPPWFRKVPLPRPRVRAWFHLPRRNVYLTPYGLVRGWIAQQIMKVSATLKSTSDVVAHIDSDNFFIRPLSPSLFIERGKVRFYAGTETLGLKTHQPWYTTGARLLGLDGSDFYTADYIDQFITWRPSVVELMVRRIEETAGENWAAALARTPHFAEYVLYGLFVERVMGIERAGLTLQTHSLSHTAWAEEGHEQNWSGFVASLLPHHVDCAIQSTLPMSIEERYEIFEKLVAKASTQAS